jgi:translocation and assembly module TamA
MGPLYRYAAYAVRSVVLRPGRRALIALLPLLLLAWSASVCAASAIEVAIAGVDGAPRDNVLLFLSIQQQKNLPELSESRIRLLHALAAGEIRAALQPFGYYQPRIDGTLVYRDGQWIATYHIDPGAPVRIVELDVHIEGDASSDPEFRQRLADLPIKQGDILVHARYEAAKRALQNLGARRGYFDAELLRNDVRVDLADNSARISLHYASGARYRFGAVTFQQADGLELPLLQRYVPFKQGEPYDSNKILKLQTALGDSEYFQQVDVEPRRDQAEDLAVPVDIKLTLRERDKYTLGAGYGTDTGARGKIGWERRIVDTGGRRFSTELNASQINTSITARYRIPIQNPLTDQIVITGGWTDDHPETSDSQTRLLSISRNQARGEWREAYSLNYRHERFVTGEDSGKSTLFIPEVNWQRIRADNRINTAHGSRLQIDFRGAAVSLASDVTFFQTRINTKFILPVSEHGRFLARVDGGHTSVKDFENLPASLRFYAGGDQSVRGYDYNSLGPLDSLGSVAGGKYLLVGSIEYEQRLVGKWSAATFYDVGNAYNTSSEDFKQGAGLGLRWRSPIGPVRADMAWALSLDEHPWRFHLVVGPDL